MNDPVEYITTILSAIGYTKDKKEFADKFIQNVRMQSTKNMLEQLPHERRQQIGALVQSDGGNTTSLEAEVVKCFSKEQVEKSLSDAAKVTLQEFLATIYPSLTSERRLALDELIKKVSSTTAQAA